MNDDILNYATFKRTCSDLGLNHSHFLYFAKN
ncbi:hypothetical protein F9B77_01865 [Staphylococcus epidermidis]|uniref:Uncharacterized protein n=3 Tax=Staphylococcus TaxID=1279 RepID=Q5HP45_STAEQ|nr:hypothetical protein SERP1068 [Staphylococcus epidermidis RP62A]AVA12113.1 hypothetical protein AL514_11135 [Staphylococcus epidermidis]TBW74274.1 hypothetical protein EQ811_12940 [Staphylococcus capitis]AVG09564.1 hypothetical protein AL521_07665 [Staphylococcus epidermidis]AXE41499.1 hypothetical protein DQW72_06460 [Staphylococcus epidermidis]